MEDLGGDAWRIFCDILDRLKCSLGTFLGGFLEGLGGIRSDSMFLDCIL